MFWFWPKGDQLEFIERIREIQVLRQCDSATAHDHVRDKLGIDMINPDVWDWLNAAAVAVNEAKEEK